NEVDSVEYSGSWLQPFFPPSPSLLATIGLGKSYPVTAAQLPPVSTGFLAPIHFFKLAKNWGQNYPLALRGSRFIYLHSRGLISYQFAHDRRRRLPRLQSHPRTAGKVSRRAVDRDRRLSVGRFQKFARLSRRLRRARSGDARLARAIRKRKVRYHFSSGVDYRHDVARPVRPGA